MPADEDTLFDLIVAMKDHLRFLEAAALRTGDPARRAQCQRQSRAVAMMVSRVTRDLAQHGERHALLSNRDLEGYVDSLIDAYSGDGSDPAACADVPEDPVPPRPRLT